MMIYLISSLLQKQLITNTNQLKDAKTTTTAEIKKNRYRETQIFAPPPPITYIECNNVLKA